MAGKLTIRGIITVVAGLQTVYLGLYKDTWLNKQLSNCLERVRPCNNSPVTHGFCSLCMYSNHMVHVIQVVHHTMSARLSRMIAFFSVLKQTGH